MTREYAGQSRGLQVATVAESWCINGLMRGMRCTGRAVCWEQPPLRGGVSREPGVPLARRESTGELLRPPLLCFTACCCPGLAPSPPHQAHTGLQPSAGCLPQPRIAPAARPYPCSSLPRRTRSLALLLPGLLSGCPSGSPMPSSFLSPLATAVPFLKLPSCGGWVVPLPSQETPARLSPRAGQRPRRGAAWARCCRAGLDEPGVLSCITGSVGWLASLLSPADFGKTTGCGTDPEDTRWLMAWTGTLFAG